MPNIVFIHGHSGSKHSFDYLKEYFPDAVFFDLPGFGDAPKPDVAYTKEYFLKFLEEKITKPSILVGYSMGALLAKDFAIAHPKLVMKLILVDGPLQKDKESLRQVYRKGWLSRQYIDKTIWSKLLCYGHEVYRLPLLGLVLLFRPRQYMQARDWFKHTYHSAISSIHDYILKDDWSTLLPLKSKTVLIYGEKDHLVDPVIAAQFNHYVIPGMKHWYFDWAAKVAEIIKKEPHTV